MTFAYETSDIILPTSVGTRLACKLWTVQGVELAKHAVKIILYPGWLDNCGSFETLAKVLVSNYGFALLCVDPPGCGRSEHYPPQKLYNDFEEVPMIGDLADALGWDRFSLIGHSRGGGVVAFACGLLGDRIVSCVVLDAYASLSGLWIEEMKKKGPRAPAQMRDAWDQNKRNTDRQVRVFATLGEAIKVNREHPWFPKSTETATNIVMRHVRPAKNGGYTFIHDPRTYGQKQFMHANETQINDFLVSITAPVLFMPDDARWRKMTEGNEDIMNKLKSRVAVITKHEYAYMDGKGHHFHSDHPELTASICGPWILKQHAAAGEVSGKRAAKL